MNLDYVYKHGKVQFINNINMEGITITTVNNKNVQSPKYCSWAGYNSWCETISDNFKLTQKQIRIALLQPEKDIDWVMKYDVSKLGIIHPFMDEDLDQSFAIEYITNDWNVLISYKIACAYKNILRVLNPKTKEEFNKFKYLGNESEYLKLFSQLKQKQKLNRWEIAVFGCIGVYNKKIVRIAKILTDNNIDYVNENFTVDILKKWKVIDPDYLKPTIKGLLNSGIKATELIPEFSKKEANELLILFLKNDINNFTKKQALHKYMAMKTEIPIAWYFEIETKKVADWTNRHIKKLSGSRVIYGPGGESQTLHYHQLLTKITDDMVPSIKTSWDRVINEIQKIAQEQIEAELGHDKPLPQLKKVRIDKVYPITSSKILKDEGENMNHCVGGYIKACLQKKSYIYHVGAPAPKGATVEICNKNSKFEAVQSWGYSNKTPNNEDKVFIKKLVNALNK